MNRIYTDNALFSVGGSVMGENFKYFRHDSCEYFPCHCADGMEEFNCLFCYCPLYALGSGCGGNFSYTEDGVKDCSACLIPHRRSGYEYILKQYDRINDIALNNR